MFAKVLEYDFVLMPDDLPADVALVCPGKAAKSAPHPHILLLYLPLTCYIMVTR